jgi:hypothetical protein
MMFWNRLLSGIFGPKKQEVRGGWRKLHDEELQNFYWTLDIIKFIE